VAKLIYSAIASLDGCVEDKRGNFDWGAPDEEVFGFVHDLERPIGTYLYGRRMYETMVYWETVSIGGDRPAVARDFAQTWRATSATCFSARSSSVAESAHCRMTCLSSSSSWTSGGSGAVSFTCTTDCAPEQRFGDA
jgi:hypothetical protein